MVEERTALAKLKSEERLARLKLKQQKVGFRGQAARFAGLKQIRPAPRLSQEQGMLREMFGGSEPLWGTGRNLPKLEHTLNSGGGIIKSGDEDRETASLFGLR